MDKAEIVRIGIFFNRLFKSVKHTENTPLQCQSNNTDTIDVYLSERIGAVGQKFISNFFQCYFKHS